MNYYEKEDKDINISKIDNNLIGEFTLHKLKDFFSDSNNYITDGENSRDYSNNNLEYSIGLKFKFDEIYFNEWNSNKRGYFGNYIENINFGGNITLLKKSSGGN